MGIDKIRCYGEYRGVPIYRSYSVAGEQVYLGNGQGCDTFWFRSVEDARRFIDAYIDTIKSDKKGLGLIPVELCKNCRCHYPYGTPEWQRTKDWNCFKFKQELIRTVLKN